MGGKICVHHCFAKSIFLITEKEELRKGIIEKMKKNVITALLVLFCCTLSACGCKHTWDNATCQTPKTCSQCGATEGDVAEHQWTDATCVAPRTCTVCGETEGEPLPHNWMPATCTAPKTCVSCGAFEGDALGHKWEPATCTSPKICSVCKDQEGEPLAHSVPEYETTADPSCTAEGQGKGICTICGNTVDVTIPPLGHNPGEWTVEKEPTYYESGEREKRCTVCEEIVEKETFDMTEEEKETWYRKECQKYNYKDLARNPDDYKGKYALFTCEIATVVQEGTAPGELSYYYVYTKGDYWGYWENPMIIAFDTYGQSRLVEGDIITVYGELGGLHDMWGENYPLLLGKFYDRKN